jgi:uncharacterized membrane protein
LAESLILVPVGGRYKMVKGDGFSSAEDEKETGRVEAFSDGIFGIAITLLVLDIKVPNPAVNQGHTTLLHALLKQWPAYFSFLNSFLTILIMWINHHKLFQQIRRSDHIFLVLNGLLLMGVTFVPFPTAVLAAHINTPDATTAAAFYSGTFLVIAILFYVLWLYASHDQRLLSLRHNAQSVAAITRQYNFGPPLYLITFLLAFVSVWASIGMCTGLALFFSLPGITKKDWSEQIVPRQRRRTAS